ncbi:MAG: GNAT family N-acetyltransferase [Chloroflexi bacterium]|nr:MAG: GNAT family N-acetyltransferase [Chloroflexota bacterium]
MQISFFCASPWPALFQAHRELAYLTARAFMDACLSCGLRPVWGCWPENEPSVRLARKLGFQLDCEQPVCLWVDEEGWNRGED